jgi:hypothetical protein
MRIPVRFEVRARESGGDERYCDDERACSVTRVADSVAQLVRRCRRGVDWASHGADNKKPADAQVIGGSD